MIKSFLARIGCLMLVVALGAGIWYLGDDVAGWWNRLEMSTSSEPSERLARHAEDKLQELADGRSDADVVLTQAELQSLLTYRLDPLLVEGVDEPMIQVGDSSVLVSARLVAEELGDGAPVEVIDRFLSDSTTVIAELQPEVFTEGVAQVRVLGLQAGTFMVPTMFVPWILNSLEIPGIEATGSLLIVPIPPDVTAIEVSPGEIRLKTAD